MPDRESTNILDSILRSAVSGCTESYLMRESSLTLNQFKEYCDLLTKKGLLNYDPVNGIYKITQKGQRFISAYDKLFDLLLDTKGGQSDPISSVESVESIERYSGKFPSSE